MATSSPGPFINPTEAGDSGGLHTPRAGVRLRVAVTEPRMDEIYRTPQPAFILLHRFIERLPLT